MIGLVSFMSKWEPLPYKDYKWIVQPRDKPSLSA